MIKKKIIDLIILLMVTSAFNLNAKDDHKNQICRIQAEENLVDFVKNHWQIPSIHKEQIEQVSRLFDLSPELILSAFLVEDIRFYTPSFTNHMLNETYIKGQFRLLIPNNVLNFFGHSPNLKYSNLGLVHIKSIKKSIKYLLKNSIATAPYFDTLQKVSQSKIPLTPELAIAIHLKAIETYWHQSQVPLKTFLFTDSSWSFRVGVWITLYSILQYDGIHSNDFVNKSGEIKKPHSNPKLGGTMLWNCISYGELVKLFIDLHLYDQSKIITAPTRYPSP